MRTLLLLLSPLVVACSDIVLQDDLLSTGDELPTAAAGLHTPYAAGTRVHIRAAREGDDSAALRVESRSAAVLNAVDRGAAGTAFLAVRAGFADLAVVEDGETLYGETIEVVEPDAVELVVDAVPQESLDLSVGASLTVELHYLGGGRALYGRGSGVVEADGDLTVTVLDGGLERLELAAQRAGDHTLSVRRGDRLLGEWMVRAR